MYLSLIFFLSSVLGYLQSFYYLLKIISLKYENPGSLKSFVFFILQDKNETLYAIFCMSDEDLSHNTKVVTDLPAYFAFRPESKNDQNYSCCDESKFCKNYNLYIYI